MKRKKRLDSLANTLAEAIAHHRAGRLDQAEERYRLILKEQPNHVDAQHLLGLVLDEYGQHENAIALIESAISLHPTALMCSNLAKIIQQQGDPDRAVSLCRQAIALDPSYANAHNNLGNALYKQGKISEAIESYLQVIALEPVHADAYSNLGLTAYDLDRLDEAGDCARKALEIDPDHAIAHNLLGNVLRGKGAYDAAIPHFERAIALAPDYALAYSNLANVLREQGQPERAMPQYRRSLEIDPQQPGQHGNLLFNLLSIDGIAPEEIFAEYRRFAERFEAPLRSVWPAHSNSRDPHKRLKVGYVSGDFRDHAVAYFFEPVLAGHNRSQVEIFCYYNNLAQDEVTRRIAAACDHWIPCKNLSDDALAQRIRADSIDILIDLSGHTANNRLLVFARKPAPIQMTWMGVPSTTGLDAIDYRITDAAVDPVGMTERYHSETLLRMPITAPFRLPANQPPVNDLPALTQEVFTFASLNNLAKVSSAALELWAKILTALPHARLMLGNADASAKQRLLDIFGRFGVPEDRLLILPRLPLDDYLQLHNHIDLALDPFPYNGGITTLHSLSMGVPVVTLIGNNSSSRWGAGLMINAGLPEFATATPDDYVQFAIALTKDLPRLQAIRQSLPRTCPLLSSTNDGGFTRHLEQAFHTVWETWCESSAQDTSPGSKPPFPSHSH